MDCDYYYKIFVTSRKRTNVIVKRKKWDNLYLIVMYF